MLNPDKYVETIKCNTNDVFQFIPLISSAWFLEDHMKIAQQFFQLVGGSASECGMFESVHVSTIYHWVSRILTGEV